MSVLNKALYIKCSAQRLIIEYTHLSSAVNKYISFLSDGNVLELDSGDGCTKLNDWKLTELGTLKQCIS